MTTKSVPVPPMDGLSKYDPLQGGYNFLSKTDNGATFHPGIDLNCGNGGDADLGVPVRAVIDGKIYAISRWNGHSTGFGNHLFVAFCDGSYGHYCHLNSMVSFPINQEVSGGTQLGTCGKTGNQTWAHLHFEARRTEPPNVDYWPYGVSEAEVIANYWNPFTWYRQLFMNQGDVSMLSQWQIVNWILVDLYNESGLDFNPESAINKAWADELRAGRYRGRPLEAEKQITNGAWQEFTLGIGVWQNGQMSWNG